MNPRESGQFISRLSRHVKVCNERIGDLSEKIFNDLLAGKITLDSYSDHPCHPAPKPAAVNWIFLVDTLNFCFWSLDDYRQWEVEWKGVSYTGYFALCAAVNRAMEKGLDITNPEIYGRLKLEDLSNILVGDNGVQLSLIPERLECLHQVAKTLIEKYNGNFMNCINVCNQSAQALLELVVSEFPCFRDEAMYCGEQVSFYKRAQILIGDIWACFKGQDIGTFNDIDSLTMFADYRVPQVLVHFEVLQYSNELKRKLLDGVLLPNGCSEEVEIRGCSIEVVERVRNWVQQLIKDSGKQLFCNSVLIDHYLWLYRREHRTEFDKVPFHKTLCIYY